MSSENSSVAIQQETFYFVGWQIFSYLLNITNYFSNKIIRQNDNSRILQNISVLIALQLKANVIQADAFFCHSLSNQCGWFQYFLRNAR